MNETPLAHPDVDDQTKDAHDTERLDWLTKRCRPSGERFAYLPEFNWSSNYGCSLREAIDIAMGTATQQPVGKPDTPSDRVEHVLHNRLFVELVKLVNCRRYRGPKRDEPMQDKFYWPLEISAMRDIAEAALNLVVAVEHPTSVGRGPVNHLALLDWLKPQCSRLSYGKCSTHRCLKRGGWKPSDARVNYDLATCEYYDISVLLGGGSLGVSVSPEKSSPDHLADQVTPTEEQGRLLRPETTTGEALLPYSPSTTAGENKDFGRTGSH